MLSKKLKEDIVMNYSDFIIKYPLFDLCMEIFKGIAPTLVALLVVYINNKITNNNDREKIENDLKYKIFAEAKLLAIDVNNLIFTSGTAFLDFVQNIGNNSEEERLNNSLEATAKMMLSARKLQCYTESEVALASIKEFSFLDYFKVISEFAESFTKILSNYNKKAKNVPIKDYGKLLDWVQEELIKESEIAEKAVVNYIKGLSIARDKMILNNN